MSSLIASAVRRLAKIVVLSQLLTSVVFAGAGSGGGGHPALDDFNQRAFEMLELIERYQKENADELVQEFGIDERALQEMNRLRDREKTIVECATLDKYLKLGRESLAMFCFDRTRRECKESIACTFIPGPNGASSERTNIGLVLRSGICVRNSDAISGSCTDCGNNKNYEESEVDMDGLGKAKVTLSCSQYHGIGTVNSSTKFRAKRAPKGKSDIEKDAFALHEAYWFNNSPVYSTVLKEKERNQVLSFRLARKLRRFQLERNVQLQ